jgi:2'-5' RNA ligase
MSAPSDLVSTSAPAGQSVADRVKAQLQRDYPPGALGWVDDLTWTGPARVPVDQIDRSTGDWSAGNDKRKVALFARRIAAGWAKPVVLVRTPGRRLLYAVDGHTRILGSDQAGQPVTAWIGTAKTDHGSWESTHRKQLANDGEAIELSGTLRSGWIGLNLPDGTIKAVPDGVTDHHVTIVFLGKDVDDDAFAAACERAKQAAASMPGPLPAVVGDIGTFPPSGSSDGKRPVFAKAKIRGGHALRSQLEDLSASEHPDWKPHVTLAYVGKDDPLPNPVPATPVRFTHLSVHRGNDVRRFALGTGKEKV